MVPGVARQQGQSGGRQPGSAFKAETKEGADPGVGERERDGGEKRDGDGR